MKEYVAKSKVYVLPERRNKFLLILINICIIVLAVISIIGIAIEGVKAFNISTGIVSLLVAIGFRRYCKAKPYYKFSTVRLIIDQSILRLDYDTGRSVTINPTTVKSVEYSDRLNCIRFVCNYSLTESSSTTAFEGAEYLLYISASENPDFIKHLEEVTYHQVSYVDRAL